MKEYILYMYPDCFDFLFDEEGDADGAGGSVTVENQEINVSIPGMDEWLSEYMWQVLAPYESGKLTREELNKTFDWKSFHQTGIELAKEVKKRLPPYVTLIYKSPFEDISGLIKPDFVIDKNSKLE